MAKYGDKNSNLSGLFGKTLGKQNPKGTSMSKFLGSSSLDSLGNQVESAGYIQSEIEDKNRVIPTVNFSKPPEFAKYGSAEQYYKTSVERIYKTYPYDGSKKEKLQWSLSSSYLDNYIFDNEYPRTNGLVSFSPLVGGLASAVTHDPGTGNESYTLAVNPQYISVKGGPNQASLPIHDQLLNKGTDFKNPEHKANFYDTANNRTKNITIDGTTGNTVEFWFRSDGDLYTSKAIFDAWNGDNTSATQIGSASYGRMLLENRYETSGDAGPPDLSLFHFTYHSGTTGASRVPIFPFSVIGTPVNDVFNHFAVTVRNSGNKLNIKTFINGDIVDNLLTGTAVSEVTGDTAGGINANIGAYRTYPSEGVKGAALALGTPVTDFNGFGNVTGSVDEFRFWKTARTENQIGTNWFTQVGAGTNTDTANTKLGFYFKFNEGITGDSNADQTVLDYSGRVSNGTYINYSEGMVYGELGRSTESAIVLASAAEREFKDPIIYPHHPEVSTYKKNAMKKGEEWDYRNPSMLYRTLPSWIQEEDSEKNRDTILGLVQIMSSYFDTLHLQIDEMKRVKTNRYLSSSVDTHTKPFPYSSKLLKNAGFVAPEIFAETDVLASLLHRDDNREYEKKLYDVKNYIYQNVYNNLTFINKSKGTQKAIRNLIRCFGVDDEIYKINLYADNAEYTLTNNFVDKTVRKTYADFNDTTRHNATVFSFKNSTESNNFGFITGSTNTSTGFDIGLAMTAEAEVILPKKPDQGSPSAQDKYYQNLTSSLFGIHSAKIAATSGELSSGDTTWDSNDYANFQVYAVADTYDLDEQHSKSVQFILKSRNSVLPELTSSVYLGQYEDTKWNFAVRVKPKGYPDAGSAITGSTGKTYDVEFEGIAAISDLVINSFKATGSISNTAGLRFITQKKRMYAGAHRTNFSGSLLDQSDALVSSCRYWATDINSDEFKAHAIDPTSYGVENPNKNEYLFVTRYDPHIEVPKIKTLVLNWEFDTVTGSNSSGQFVVKDSSYTQVQDEKNQNWGTDLGNLLETNNDALGFGFEENSDDSVIRDYVPAYKQQLPENINDSNMITVAQTDDLTFTKNTLPVKFSFALEKSMYQTISEEMINFFITSKEASALENLYGDPVNRYRLEYKALEKFKNLFFNRVGNTPDLEKYLNFYKWLDNSISDMVKELVPVSAKMPGVTNVVESHMLERGGKYQSKFPTLEMKEPTLEDPIRGINEMLYNWKRGHAPIPKLSNVGTQATATMTGILDTSGIPAALDTQTIVIINTAGLSKTYKFMNGGGKANGDIDGGSVVIQLSGEDSKEGLVDNIKQAIESSNGHSDSISVSRDGAVITLTQAAFGPAGNTTITFSAGINTSTELSKTNFVGGTETTLNQNTNCFWWNKRAIRTTDGLWSGDADIDIDRKLIHTASVQVLNRTLDTTVRLKLDRMGVTNTLNKKQFIFGETPPGTAKNIKFNTTTFSEPVNCDDEDNVTNNPRFKFKPQFKVEGDGNGSRFQGRMVSPLAFRLSSSHTDQGTDPDGFYRTDQHLQDYYSETKDIPLQGPFTEQHVGGYQYRHTGLNIGLASIRQEGWFTTATKVGSETFFIIYNPSAIAAGYPRADYSRDHIAKSPLNIKNIKNVTSSKNPNVGTTNELGSSIALGNYSHDYEIVQIPGRSINNKYFIENLGVSTASAESTFIDGLNDRTIPNKSTNKYVIANRFSAPGGPDTLGAGYLNYESETFSVYNALPYRNLAVRSPLNNILLRRRSGFGGYDAQYPINHASPVASYHKTQRNGAKRLKIDGQPGINSHDGLVLTLTTASVFDNAFVQHMIPQSDMQYSWIDASAIMGPFGYEQPDPSLASLASTDISFVTKPDLSAFRFSNGARFYPTQMAGGYGAHPPFAVAPGQIIDLDFVGLNKVTVPIDADLTGSNTIKYRHNETFVPLAQMSPSSSATLLNINISKYGGVGGFSSWVQTRQMYNPVVRNMKKTNRMSFVRTIKAQHTDFETNGLFVDEDRLYSYTEPAITSKFKPLQHKINLWNFKNKFGAGGEQIIINSSYGNNLAYFTMTNTQGVLGVFDSMTETIGFLPPQNIQVYDNLKRLYVNNELDSILYGANPIAWVPSFAYREVVYPKESNTFLARTRMRQNYSEASGSAEFNKPLGKARTFWRDQREDRLRSINFARNSFGIRIDSGSFRETSFQGVLDLSCWPLDAAYPMVQFAPTGSSANLVSPITSVISTNTPRGMGSFDLPTDHKVRTLNGELSYGNYLFNLYRVPLQGEALTADSTLGTFSPPTASQTFEYPSFVLSGNDQSTANGMYSIAHLSLVPQWTANLTASRNPWFDSYEEYSNDIRRIGKDYSVIPEFKISDNMDYYLKSGNTIKGKIKNYKFLDLPGASTSITSSAKIENAPQTINPEFYRLYSHSDFMKHFEIIREDHLKTPEDAANVALLPTRIRLKCKGIKKLLPYQGFYPALRTVQLGELFSASFGPSLTGAYDPFTQTIDVQKQKLAALMQPFFAPGIMYNTIKSGIAVDWPVITASVEQQTPGAGGGDATINGTEPIYGFRGAGVFNFNPQYRMPFEAILKPHQHIPEFSENPNAKVGGPALPAYMYHLWPHFPSASATDPTSLGSGERGNSIGPTGSGAPLGQHNWYSRLNGAYVRPQPNCAWTGEYDKKYSLAMSNFMSEVVDFFLEEQQLTSFVSKPEKEFTEMMSGSTYYMDVVLRKTDNFKMYEGPDKMFAVSTHATGTNTIFTSSVGARGIHYGPSFLSRRPSIIMRKQQQVILDQLGDPGPAPYTPPYFYGKAIARISFKPHVARPMDVGTSEKFKLAEILANAKVISDSYNEGDNSNGLFEYKMLPDPLNLFGSKIPVNFASGSAAFQNQMPIESSVRLYETVSGKKVTYNVSIGDDGQPVYNPSTITEAADDTSLDRWCIETKFECPVLDFSDHKVQTSFPSGNKTYYNGDGDERNLTTGIWRTYGKLPSDNPLIINPEGIFLEIKESFPQQTNVTKGSVILGQTNQSGRGPLNPRSGQVEFRGRSRSRPGQDGTLPDWNTEIDVEYNTTGSLVEVCGFETDTKRIGRIAESKQISEAIVAIPVNTDGSFVKIPKDGFLTQLKNLTEKGIAIDEGDFGSPLKVKDTSISDMIKKMRKFVIPPHLDFLHNKDVLEDKNMGPFVMYIFEFNHTLSQQDLSNIWQNVMPDISVTAAMEESVIEHPVLTGKNFEFFGTDTGTISGKGIKATSEIEVFPKNLRWMVFKAKQRGKNNFDAISITGEKEIGFGLKDLNSSSTSAYGGNQLAFSYNWPYDFFSLVELGKVEVTHGFEPRNSPMGAVEEPPIEDQQKTEYHQKGLISSFAGGQGFKGPGVGEVDTTKSTRNFGETYPPPEDI